MLDLAAAVLILASATTPCPKIPVWAHHDAAEKGQIRLMVRLDAPEPPRREEDEERQRYRALVQLRQQQTLHCLKGTEFSSVSRFPAIGIPYLTLTASPEALHRLEICPAVRYMSNRERRVFGFNVRNGTVGSTMHVVHPEEVGCAEELRQQYDPSG